MAGVKQSKTNEAISPLNGGKALSMHQQSTPLTAVDWGKSLVTEQAAAVPVASSACNRSRIYLRTQNDHAPHITANRHTHTHTHTPT